MGPIGCIPYQLTLRLSQNGQCDPKVNAEARQFNAGVVSIVKELNVQLPGAKLIVVDAYKGVSEMIANPGAYGMHLSSLSYLPSMNSQHASTHKPQCNLLPLQILASKRILNKSLALRKLPTSCYSSRVLW